MYGCLPEELKCAKRVARAYRRAECPDQTVSDSTPESSGDDWLGLQETEHGETGEAAQVGEDRGRASHVKDDGRASTQEEAHGLTPLERTLLARFQGCVERQIAAQVLLTLACAHVRLSLLSLPLFWSLSVSVSLACSLAT